jgi:hypothetical protein
MAFNIYKWRRDQLLLENEGEETSTVITKKIKDLTWEDVEGLALPTKTASIFTNMKLRHNLDSWKKALSEKEQELEVTIDKSNKMWSDQVKIEKLTQSDPMGFQADIDAKKGKRFGLDENESKPTHRSNVDWYYIEEYSDYPGLKGGTVPNTHGYADPTGYDGTELYVPEGTVGYVSGNKFIVTSGKREGNDVEYKAEYFDEI